MTRCCDVLLAEQLRPIRFQDMGGHPAAVVQRRLGVRRERPLLVRACRLA